MAYIFQKANSTGTDQCIVLQSQELFIVPYYNQVGNWNELRVSAYLSYCGVSGFNSLMFQEVINNTLPKAAWYWGIGTFNSTVLPYSNGSNFIGVTTYPNATTELYINNASVVQHNNSADIYFLATNNTGSQTAIYMNNAGAGGVSFPAFPPYSDATGNTNYCQANTLIYKMSGQGQTGQTITILSSYENGTASINEWNSAGDIQSLRLSSMTLDHTGTIGENYTNFYWTSGLVANGGPLPVPNSIFFYSPFYYNLLRIHALVAEKFA